ncbi:MAG: CDP-archaeol synthase [Pseudomonadota bacterium]|nr:MAG: CDP-archaeol synthase [Pseudomonadota bacterium]
METGSAIPLLQSLLLLLVANGAPIAARQLLPGKRAALPLDAGKTFVDGHPVFGASKTVRGLLAALTATTITAVVMGLSWQLGLLTGALAMCGDLMSSFIKRRMGLAPSTRATGLDQIPEALLPLLVLRMPLALTVWDIAVVVAAFVATDVLLSRVLFRLHIRKRPY